MGVRDRQLENLDVYLDYLHSIFEYHRLRYGYSPVVLGRSFSADVLLEYVKKYPRHLAGVIPMSGYSREALAYNTEWFEKAVASGAFRPNREGFEWANKIDSQMTWLDSAMGDQTPILYLAGRKDPEYPADAWRFWEARAQREGQEGFFPEEGKHDLLDSRNLDVFRATIARMDAFAARAVEQSYEIDRALRIAEMSNWRRNRRT